MTPKERAVVSIQNESETVSSLSMMRTAMQQALEALESCNVGNWSMAFDEFAVVEAITALREALAEQQTERTQDAKRNVVGLAEQAEQEPYAYEIDLIMEGVDKVGYPLLTSDKTAIERLSGNKNYSLKPLYAAPCPCKRPLQSFAGFD